MKSTCVLCPIDLSENSRQAVDFAAEMVDVMAGGELILLYVAIPELPTSSGFAIASVESAIDEERKQLAGIAPTRPDITFRHEVRRGEPADVICKFAEEEGADLIVMTTHGRSGLSRLLMGSVAEHVLRHSPCPVLTVRTPVRQPATRKS